MDRGEREVLKRWMDVCLSILLLLLLAPLFLLIAVIIKLDSRGPVFFKQKRIGKDGKPFMFLKFRSMYWNTDHSLHKNFVREFIEGKTKDFKLKKDPRITRFGYFLRKTSLDELPQLINVLKGEMSLVGPRPPIEYEVEMYDERAKKRLSVKPGITGEWQCRGRSQVPFEKMIDMDLQYVESWSLSRDIVLIMKTLFVVLSGKGAY